MFSLFLLLVLSAALPAEAQNWKAFKNKHIYKGMKENQCKSVIEDNGINPSGTCKRMNSFIQATDDQVKAVCGNAGHHVRNNLHESNLPFSVVTCTSDGSNSCIYKGHQGTVCITIACERGLPVHYEKERAPKDGKC